MTEEKEENKIEDLAEFDDQIKLYPFNGRSNLLIDKFYIIGYNYLTLYKLLIEDTPKIIEEDNERETKEPHKFNIDEEPFILNEFSSDYNKVSLPNDTVLSMIFPKQVDFYYTSEENANQIKGSLQINNDFNKIEFNKDKSQTNFPKSYKVVFTSNPQAENNSKKSINGLAYIFYRKFTEKKLVNKKSYTYYIPYVFCIISEFPFFNSFYKLMKYIKMFFSSDQLYIPIEFLIYNIVNFSPSPLQSDIILDLKSSIEQYQSLGILPTLSHSTINSLKSCELTAKSSFDNDLDMKNINKNKDLRKTAIFSKEIDKSFTVRKNSKAGLKKFNSEPMKNDDYLINFKFVSGYPLIQYNLSKVLFYTLNPEKVIITFLYTFLEKDVLFFSNNIEYLSVTLNAYLNLNFPLNDEKYYFIGAPISFDDFSNGNSEFGLKNYTSIIGINDQYRPNYKNKNLKLADHLVVDLDKGELYEGPDENNSYVNERNKKTIEFIKKACRGVDDEKIKETTLYQSIKYLSDSLNELYKSITDSYDKKDINFIDCKDDDGNDGNNNNREIQEAFYEFINYICTYFYENIGIRFKEDELRNQKNDDNIKDKEKENQKVTVIFEKNLYNKKEGTNIEDKLIFFDELTETMKFQSFVFGFLQSYNPIDLYKVPLTFTEEFLSILSKKKEKARKKIKYFDLIDTLYINNRKNPEMYVDFNFVNFNYFNNFKSLFDREISELSKSKYYDEKSHLIGFANDDNNQLIIKNDNILIYQTYELDERLLLKYTHFIKNTDKEKFSEKFYKSLFIEEKERVIKDIKLIEIESLIENSCIKSNILSSDDIFCANLILLFTISLKLLIENIDCPTFLGYLFQEFPDVFRKYYTLLIKIIYKLYQETINKKQYSKGERIHLCYYPCINSMRIKKLVPNEDLINIINQFYDLKIGEIKISDEEQKENKIKKKLSENLKLYGDQLEEEDITYENVYTFHNFTSDRFIEEKEILKLINESYEDPYEINIDGQKMTPRIRFNNGIHKMESFYYSQKILLDYLIIEYKKYFQDLDESNLSSKLLLDACLNLIIFMRNSDLYDKDELMEGVKNIFYIFMNQLYITKAEKENESNNNN